METHKKSGIVHGPLPSGEKKKKKKPMRRCCGPEGLGGSPPYPTPEQETESLNAMKLASLVHMTNFIPAIQTFSRRVCRVDRRSACKLKVIVPNVIPKPSWSVVIMAEKMRVVPDIMLPVASSVIDMVIESPGR